MEFVRLYRLLIVLVSLMSSGDPTHIWCEPGDGYVDGTMAQCLWFQIYNRNQWATCISKEYMAQIIYGADVEFACGYYKSFCYLHCMYEQGVYSGEVFDSCACSTLGETKNISLSEINSLPSDCYSPNGEDCTWYAKCLEKKYPCEGSDAPYAIKFAEFYCKAYENRKGYFSVQAKKWIGKTRECLQKHLVPFLRAYSSPTCKKIKEAAFRSHVPCYVDEGFCDLKCYDFPQVLWTIKESAFPKNGLLL